MTVKSRYRDLPFARVGIILVSFYFVALFVNLTWVRLANAGDSKNLISGTDAALGCLARGELVGCGHSIKEQTSVMPYALLQYIPASIFHLFGLSDAANLRALAFLSAFSVILILTMTLVIFRKYPRVGCLAVATLIGSSLLFQADVAFGEAFAALMLVVAIYAALERKVWLLFVFVFLASMSKETMPFFIAILALVCARENQRALLPRRVLTVSILSAAVLGLAASLLFNIFRFGTIRNLNYLDPLLQTRGAGNIAQFFAALWLSPSSGILWFWPTATVIVVVSIALTVTALIRCPKSPNEWLPPLAVLVTLDAYIAGLALWYSPFGWIAHGPRLAVPILTAGIVILLHFFGNQICDALARGWIRAVAASAAIVFVSIPQFGAPWRYTDSIRALIRPGPGCPPLNDRAIQNDVELYYRCGEQTMWRPSLSTLTSTIDISASMSGLAWILAALGVFLLALQAFRPSQQLAHQPIVGSAA